MSLPAGARRPGGRGDCIVLQTGSWACLRAKVKLARGKAARKTGQPGGSLKSHGRRLAYPRLLPRRCHEPGAARSAGALVSRGDFKARSERCAPCRPSAPAPLRDIHKRAARRLASVTADIAIRLCSIRAASLNRGGPDAMALTEPPRDDGAGVSRRGLHTGCMAEQIRHAELPHASQCGKPRTPSVPARWPPDMPI